MGPNDIYNVKFRWGNCEDMRPWIIIGGPIGDSWECFPISGNCYGGVDCFHLDARHADFAAAGLTKSCFIHFGSIIMIPATCFGRHRGTLGGSLLAHFIQDSGH